MGFEILFIMFTPFGRLLTNQLHLLAQHHVDVDSDNDDESHYDKDDDGERKF